MEENNFIHFCRCIFIFKFEGSNIPIASNECVLFYVQKKKKIILLNLFFEILFICC